MQNHSLSRTFFHGIEKSAENSINIIKEEQVEITPDLSFDENNFLLDSDSQHDSGDDILAKNGSVIKKEDGSVLCSFCLELIPDINGVPSHMQNCSKKAIAERYSCDTCNMSFRQVFHIQHKKNKK